MADASKPGEPGLIEAADDTNEVEKEQEDESGWEEYEDLIFPEDKAAENEWIQKVSKFYEMDEV